MLGDFACKREGESVWNISVNNNYFKMHFKIYVFPFYNDAILTNLGAFDDIASRL